MAIPKADYGRPDRTMMVRAAIYMERRRFSYYEWSIIARLCDSSAAIRDHILPYVKEALDMWDGLVPSQGHAADEIALIAAYHAYHKAKVSIGRKDRISSLLLPPPDWDDETRRKAEADYCERHPFSSRVTAKLKEALDREACEVYGEPYTTASGCQIIPINQHPHTGTKRRPPSKTDIPASKIWEVATLFNVSSDYLLGRSSKGAPANT